VNKRLYNGNISQTNWNSASINNTSNPESNQYVYTYDQLNRITSGIDNTENYNLDLVEYDKNGNITKLKRQGHRNTAATSFGTMDDLTYTYDSGNKLMKVADAATIDQFGFKDDAINTAADTSDDYSYDNNGNMTKDLNKSISSITYNHLNLPKKITIKRSVTPEYIEYVYDANGVKLEKKVSIQGFYGYTETYTMYAGNYIYNKTVIPPGLPGNPSPPVTPIFELQFFNQSEGYVEPDGLGGYDYVYQYKDYLQNIRLSYSDSDGNGTISQSEIIEENNYYPMGLKHKGYNTSIISEHEWKYNGKELQDELDLNWYDLGARNLDHALGRFMNVDPKAEQYDFQSPYAFANNNPVLFVDINGEGVLTDFKLDKKTGDITRVDETDRSENNTYDTLYATDDDGNVDESKSVMINKKEASDNTVISDLVKSEHVGKNMNGSKNLSTATTNASRQNNIFKVFLFAANNSNVEWSAVRGIKNGKEIFGVGTFQNPNESPGFHNYGLSLSQTISEVHSHPDVNPTLEGERGSLRGDRGNVQTFFGRNGWEKPYNYYIYMPNSGRLMGLNSYFSKGEYIRNIKGNYKRLYFGTLNSK